MQRARRLSGSFTAGAGFSTKGLRYRAASSAPCSTVASGTSSCASTISASANAASATSRSAALRQALAPGTTTMALSALHTVIAATPRRDTRRFAGPSASPRLPPRGRALSSAPNESRAHSTEHGHLRAEPRRRHRLIGPLAAGMRRKSRLPAGFPPAAERQLVSTTRSMLILPNTSTRDIEVPRPSQTRTAAAVGSSRIDAIRQDADMANRGHQQRGSQAEHVRHMTGQRRNHGPADDRDRDDAGGGGRART